MASLQTIFKSPYYFGEISSEETKKILQNNPPRSYLFRRLENGAITLATLCFSLHLFEIEVRNCNCKRSFKNIESFRNLEAGIRYCNNVFCLIKLDTEFSQGGFNLFKFPVLRKNALPLEEMAKSCVRTHYVNSIDKLNLPNIIKNNLGNHDHFDTRMNFLR